MLKNAYQNISYQLFGKKMKSPAGVAVFLVVALVFSYLVLKFGFVAGPLMIAVVLGMILFTICLTTPYTAFYVTIFCSCFTFFPARVTGVDLPISTCMELLIYGVYLGWLLNRKKLRTNDVLFYKSPSTVGLFIFLLLIIVEVFNPNYHSFAGWFLYLRKYILFVVIYFTSYKLLDSLDKIRFFIKFWIGMAFLAALYTWKQQWLGFFGFEDRWVKSDPATAVLYFQGGTWRKFSFLAGAAEAGILLAVMAVFTFVLAMGHKGSRKKRRTLYLMGVVMVLAMSYTGTRTANIIMLGGFVFYILMTLNQKGTLYFTVIGVTLFMGLLVAPIDNPTLHRFRTSFQGTKDESLAIRDVNRKAIQPYIHAHPMGGGLATSAEEGTYYNPGHPLAGFPPDSGFLKTALETGWVGYAIAMFYYFCLLAQGIHYYFSSQDREVRLYILAFTCAQIVVILGLYTQSAIGQLPDILFFFPSGAIIIRLLEIDRSNQVERAKQIDRSSLSNEPKNLSTT
jgi:putative inorganic carbon (HCO3(-)) transporter